jgi:RHS repeat-associated protein
MRFQRIALLAMFSGSLLMSQPDTASPTFAMTPAAVAAGTPAGVVALSPVESVNLFSGALTFEVPLHDIGGRGSTGYTIVEPIGTRWSLENDIIQQGTDFWNPLPSSGPENSSWPGGTLLSGTGGGVVRRDGLIGRAHTYYCKIQGTVGFGQTYYLNSTLTKIVWVEANGTAHEFLDVATGGAALQTTLSTGRWCDVDPVSGGRSRGTVFESDDATGVTFIADAPVLDDISEVTLGSGGISGWLLFKDGSRQYSNTSNFANGFITQMIDRNGNQTNLMSPGTQNPVITDDLGRQTTITHANWYGNTTTAPLDTITYQGAGGTPHSITISYDRLANRLRAGFSIQNYDQLLPWSWSTTSPYNPWIVASINLPDGSSYSFQYNPFGELARATLPTGGVYEYDYPTTCTQSNGCLVPYSQYGVVNEQAVLRRLTARRVYPDGATLEGQTCYTPTFDATANTTAVQVTYFDASQASDCSTLTGNIVSTETHVFNSDPETAAYWVVSGVPIENQLNGKEIQTSWNTPTGVALKATSTTWQVDSRGVDATACQTVTTLNGTTSAGTFHLYDQYFSPSDIYEYDFGAAPAAGTTCPTSIPAGWIRHKHTSYVADGVYDTVAATAPVGPNSNHMRSLVQEQDTYDATNTLRAQTKFGYDETQITTEPGTPVGYAAPSHSKLGNLTSKQTWLNTTGTYLTTNYAYDNLGNVVKVTDPRSNPTQISYTDNCSASPTGPLFAYRTSVTNALNQTEQITWDCYIGKQTNFQDVNGVSTSYAYATSTADPFDRLLLAKRAVGKAEETHTAFSYPNLTTTIEKQDQNSLDDGVVTTTVLYDGLGRLKQTQHTSDPEGTDYIDTTYDARGRVYSVSNPHRSAASSTDGTTYHYYDALGRSCVVVLPDGTNLSLGAPCPATKPAGDVFTTYTGNCSTVTDEAGKARKSCVDGLGRIAGVWEDPAGLNYQTTYTYDANDNLTSVVQNGSSVVQKRQRTFVYDSLSRLTSAANPESGTICYGTYSGSTCQQNGYDANGNLVTKTAPAPNQTGSANVTTCFGNWTGAACDGTKGYDALNRLLLKSYSDGTTPSVQYAYDVVTQYANSPIPQGYDVGRLTGVWTSGKGAKYSHDQVGRVAYLFDCVEPTSCNNSLVGAYQYDLAGNIIKAAYQMWYWNGTGYTATTTPLTFNQSFDAAARPTQLFSDLNDSQHPATLLAVDPNVGYYPSGTIRTVSLGNGLTETAAYNNRLQPCHMNVNYTGGYYSQCTDSAPSGNVLDFTYGFNAGTNNGNIASWSATGNQTFSRTYKYDPLNRISTMQDSAASQSCQGLSWTIDAWGNRIAQTPTKGSCNTFQQSVDTSNRFGAPFQYDAAGNMIHDASHSYTYDAENRLIQVDGTAGNCSTALACYAYDPDGRRVAKTIGGTTTNYAYDTGSNVLFETQGSSWTTAYIYFAGALHAQYKNNTTYFLHRDHLGSTRLVTGVGTQIANGGFEQGLTGWGISGSTARLMMNDPTRAHSGSNYVQLSAPANGVVGILSGQVAVNPGDQVDFGGWAYLESGSGSVPGWWLAVYDGNHNYFTAVSSSPGPSSGWTYESGTYTVPSNGAYVVLYAPIYQPSVSTVLRVDDAFLAIGRTATTVDNLDYLPFGEQIAGGTSTTHKFTAKERDAESGLDYFGVRYFSGAQGRFTVPDYSSDPASIPYADLSDPQTLNLYAYVRNNPLALRDPNGHMHQECGPETSSFDKNGVLTVNANCHMVMDPSDYFMAGVAKGHHFVDQALIKSKDAWDSFAGRFFQSWSTGMKSAKNVFNGPHRLNSAQIRNIIDGLERRFGPMRTWGRDAIEEAVNEVRNAGGSVKAFLDDLEKDVPMARTVRDGVGPLIDKAEAAYNAATQAAANALSTIEQTPVIGPIVEGVESACESEPNCGLPPP